MKRQRLYQLLKYTLISITLFCVFIYGFDLAFGDGDGIIGRFQLNPLTIFLSTVLFTTPLFGLMSRRKGVVNGSLSTLSVLVTLLLIEKALPLLAHKQVGTYEYLQSADGAHPYTNQDSVYFKHYRPGARFYTQLPAVDGGHRILHEINSAGIRGPEIAPKRLDEKRILLLGDSYMQGIQVPFEKAVGPRLQEMLPDSMRVIQHGFQSWSPLLQWNWFLRKGYELRPDLVVLCTYTNDFYSGLSVGDSGYRPYAKFNAQGIPTGFDFSATNSTQKQNPWAALKVSLKKMRLVRIIAHLRGRNRARNVLAEHKLPEYLEMSAADFDTAYQTNNPHKDVFTIFMWGFLELSRDTSRWSAKLQERVQLSFRYIAGLQNTLAAQDIPLAIMHIPYPWHFENENAARKKDITNWSSFTFPAGGLQQAVHSFCQQASIPLLDLYPIIKQAKRDNPETQYYYPMDPHWNEHGQQLAADALHAFLQDQSFTK